MRMQKLAKNKERFVPQLKRVVWWFQQSARKVSRGDPPPYSHERPSQSNTAQVSNDPASSPIYYPPEDTEKLTDDFERVGVKFDRVSMPRLNDTPFWKYANMK